MDVLGIRRNRSFAVPRYQGTDKVEKQSDGVQQSRGAAQKPLYTVSETLKQLMNRVSQAETQTRESRRTLQKGEGVLDEVQDSLERIAQLARQAAGGGQTDRAALQQELEQLSREIDRMIGSASAGGTPLFLDEDAGVADGLEALLYAAAGGLTSKEEQVLPDWLMKGMAQGDLSPERLLASLGLRQPVSGAELLAAVVSRSLENDPTAGYLATLYLGAVIAGGASSGQLDPTQALEGLQQLLEKVSEGVPLDEAIAQLTNGEFSSLADFQIQFSSATAPGLQDFLTNLLLSDGGSLSLNPAPLLGLLAGLQGMNLDLLMGLLTIAQSGQPDLEAGLESEQPPADPAAVQAQTGEPSEAAQAGRASASGTPASASVSVLQLGTLQVMGRDLSGVSFDEATGTLTIRGEADVVLQGTGQGAQAVVVAGSGRVTLQAVQLSALTIDSPQAHVSSAGESVLETLELREGTSLTLDGGGQLKIGLLQANASNTLRLLSGAVTVREGEEETAQPQTIPAVVESAASLAARAVTVTSPEGKALEPFDVIWKTLLPNWSALTSLELDGRQTKLALMNGDPARLWLDKGDPNHGYSIHTLLLRGKDKSGQPQTRYAYLLWKQSTRSFEEVELYPNPFAVTGGEAGKDWVYDEETHTLNILTAQVTAIAGGRGKDENQEPFSGRVALADGIGTMELALGGVVCWVSSGRAFSLGRGNDVTLILQRGTSNLFASGAGCAGISLGEGTCLRIDGDGAPEDGPVPAGTLEAAGNDGGAGIGRDSGVGRDQDSHILICGGVIVATGAGGGAGIGAGKRGAMGPIIILGGTVTSTGGNGGGAGIGAALGAPVGDISIRGGSVTAEAVYHAAAIGAGIQGECGDILIDGTARIERALGGDPGADIGACLFGGCGKVLVADSADIGGAQLRTRTGIPLQMGEDTVTLPQFRLSSKALQLDQMSLLTPESAQTAQMTVDADRHCIAQIQGFYSALYRQMDQSFGGYDNVFQYISSVQGLVRSPDTASSLLEEMRHSILLQPAQAIGTHSKRGKEEVQLLLR